MIESTKKREEKAFEILKKKFNYKNKMQSPRLEKIVISSGVGKIKDDKRKIEIIADRLEKITGQKAVVAPAKKSIATFKVREGQISGYKSTLRGRDMYLFLDKLINIALPRTKDFRGIKRSAVDPMGNLTIGVREHLIFPETGDEELRDIFGLAITITTTAKNKEEAEEFFEVLGIPFKKKKENKE